MHHVAILAVEGCYVSYAAAFADVLQAANAHLRQQQGPSGRLLKWSFVSVDGGAVAGSNGLVLATQPLDALTFPEVVVVPAIHYSGFKPFVQFLDG